MYKSQMNFSIVIPLYNESENIVLLNKEIVDTIEILQKDSNYNFEILYVDDGSTDDTLKVLRNFKYSIPTIIIKNKNLSQSVSILNVIEASTFENIILLDGDMQNDPKDFIPMIKEYVSSENIVVHGYRKFEKILIGLKYY